MNPINTQKIANFFLEVIPIYKKHFGQNWLIQLEYSCPRMSDKTFDGLGLTEYQSWQFLKLGPRVCSCFENLCASVLDLIDYEENKL